MASPILALALIPLFTNWTTASRAGQTDTADFARDLLNSVEPYGILVTLGDNDTFPLWYAQEVEGIRRDVTVAVTSLLNTDWYPRGLRIRPQATYDVAHGPAAYRALKDKHPALAVYKREDVPPELHFSSNPRIPPVIGIASDGWTVSTSAQVTEWQQTGRRMGGQHGYDPRLRSMHGLFIASGPQFRSGVTVPAFENIHLYAMMCRVLGLSPAPNDGRASVPSMITFLARRRSSSAGLFSIGSLSVNRRASLLLTMTGCLNSPTTWLPAWIVTLRRLSRCSS